MTHVQNAEVIPRHIIEHLSSLNYDINFPVFSPPPQLIKGILEQLLWGNQKEKLEKLEFCL